MPAYRIYYAYYSLAGDYAGLRSDAVFRAFVDDYVVVLAVVAYFDDVCGHVGISACAVRPCADCVSAGPFIFPHFLRQKEIFFRQPVVLFSERKIVLDALRLAPDCGIECMGAFHYPCALQCAVAPEHIQCSYLQGDEDSCIEY